MRTAGVTDRDAVDREDAKRVRPVTAPCFASGRATMLRLERGSGKRAGSRERRDGSLGSTVSRVDHAAADRV